MTEIPQPYTQIQPLCVGCKKTPSELPEYVDMAESEGTTPDQFVRTQEGTYNRFNGHFLCTACYIKAGMPSGPRGWVAP